MVGWGLGATVDWIGLGVGALAVPDAQALATTTDANQTAVLIRFMTLDGRVLRI